MMKGGGVSKNLLLESQQAFSPRSPAHFKNHEDYLDDNLQFKTTKASVELLSPKSSLNTSRKSRNNSKRLILSSHESVLRRSHNVETLQTSMIKRLLPNFQSST